MRNFQMQAIFFSATIPIQTVFFKRMLQQKFFFAHLLAGFVTLLLPLTITA